MRFLVSMLMGAILALGVPGVAAAETQKNESATTRLLQHPESIDKALVSLGIELASVDPKITRLLVYVNGLQFQDRALKLFIWNALNSRLLRTKRFEMVDFMESQTAQITIASGGIHFSNTIESNAKLLEMASRNKVEAVMMAEIISSGDQFMLALQLIRPSDSQLLWAGRFPVPLVEEAAIPETQSTTVVESATSSQFNDRSLTIYGGSLFFGMRRKGMFTGVDDGTFWMMPSVGMRGMKRLNDSPLWLSMDVCVSRGALNHGTGDFTVLTGIPKIYLAIDPLWGGTGNILSVFAGGGQGLAMGGHGFLISGANEGLLLNIPSFPELSVGVVHMPSIDVDLFPDSDYSNQAHFGGAAFHVTMGKSF